MNFELFFAKKIIKGKENSFSRPIIRISIIAITLGIAMMTISLSIVQGFQNEIKKKVIGFGSHIQVTRYESKGLLEGKPISRNNEFYKNITQKEGIRHIQSYANKGAILKTEEDNLGVILKGISSDFDWTFFNSYLVEGSPLVLNDEKKSNDIIISRNIAKKLKLSLGDDLTVYFIEQPPRFRKLNIAGIYDTGLGEMDDKLALIDLGHIQKINKWEKDQVGGFEILIDDFSKLDEMDELVYQNINYDLVSTSIKESRIDIFNWLELQDLNVIIIVSLLILVCGIDIISALLILILERTNMIGVLKALGAKNASIRKIFIYNASYLIISGLIYGNIIGVGLSLIQKKYSILKLPQEAYFIDVVPIHIDYLNLALLNIGTLSICLLMLIIPSNLIAKIEPAESIRFD